MAKVYVCPACRDGKHAKCAGDPCECDSEEHEKSCSKCLSVKSPRLAEILDKAKKEVYETIAKKVGIPAMVGVQISPVDPRG